MITKRILVVGDKEDIGIFLNKATFKCDRHIVETVSSVLDAIYKFSENHYNILITNINMPEFSGFFLIRYVKTFFPECKVIAMSADPSLLEDARKIGICNCLLKPFTISEVMEKVIE